MNTREVASTMVAYQNHLGCIKKKQMMMITMTTMSKTMMITTTTNLQLRKEF